MSEQEKQLIRNVQAHDLAEALRLRRAKQAQEAGMPEGAFALPFPANQTVHIHKADPRWWLVPVALFGLGAGAMLGLPRLYEARREPLELDLQFWNGKGECPWQAAPSR